MAQKDAILEKLRQLLPEGSVSLDPTFRAGVAATVQAQAGGLREAVSAFKEAGFYIDTMTGLDFEDGAEVVYHFNCYEPQSRIALRVLVGEDQTLPTVVDLFEGAGWLEREVHEFFGIRFADNPDLRTLLLPEDSQEHPLKKSFGTVYATHKREEIYG